MIPCFLLPLSKFLFLASQVSLRWIVKSDGLCGHVHSSRREPLWHSSRIGHVMAVCHSTSRNLQSQAAKQFMTLHVRMFTEVKLTIKSGLKSPFKSETLHRQKLTAIYLSGDLSNEKLLQRFLSSDESHTMSRLCSAIAAYYQQMSCYAAYRNVCKHADLLK